MNNIRVQYSDNEPIIEVSSADKLEHLLDDITFKTNSGYPAVVFVTVNDHRVILGIGQEESFLQIESEVGDPPYLTTIGDPDAQGVMAFYLFGDHHTEIPRRNLIPEAKARKALLEWVRTGILSKEVEWEEI
jgi:hypothetical protein